MKVLWAQLYATRDVMTFEDEKIARTENTLINKPKLKPARFTPDAMNVLSRALLFTVR